ncbi:hypothetical protein [Actinomadura hibisca]|uniref:hypothetical protein n=1 Tax=Actinomadura hibisca TaxID=68565 RepID=UPI0008377E08|nr:hypothetical protein [Actinomadura hibisca]
MTALDRTHPTPEPSLPSAPDVTPIDHNDLLELHEGLQEHRRTRLLLNALFVLFLLPSAFAVVLNPPLSHRILLTAALWLLATLGLAHLLDMARTWCSARYSLTRTATWHYRLERRWYAPGTTVLTGPDAQRPVYVLGWLNDPACVQPWVLIHCDDDPARVVPLSQLAPLPCRPRDGAR